MNEMTTTGQKATLVEIRSDNRKYPRLHTYQREAAIGQMNMILIMAFQFRGQNADTQTIVQMSASLIDILMEDEYGIGTRFLSFEEIRRVVRRAVLGQSKEMFGISVSSIFQALADYCKGEGRMADREAKQIASRQREMRQSIIAPMIQGHIEEMLKK